MVCEISEPSRVFHTCSDGISPDHTSLAIFLFLFVHIVLLLLTINNLHMQKACPFASVKLLDRNQRHHFSVADLPVDCSIDL